MIRPIDIRLNAAHPELPLSEAVTFVNAPSTVLIRGVPPNCGRWAITAVSVAATYPDNTTTTRAAVQSANGVWVATLPATATSGRTANGLRILANGIDENGEAVTGYVLGVADFAVASLDVTPAPQPGETSYQMLYFDEVPSVLRKGDVAKVDGVLKFYNGEAWEPFATPPTLDDAVTRTSANGVKSSGIWSAIWGALSALPTGFTSLYDWCVSQLAGKASIADATLNAASYEYSAWDVSEMPSSFQGQQPYIYHQQDGGDQYYWMVSTGGVAVSDERYSSEAEANAATTITLRGPGVPNGVTVTRTRSVTSYRLGPDAGTNPNRTKLLATAEQGAKADAALPAADVVAPSTSASDSGKAADAKATGDALAGKINVSGGLANQLRLLIAATSGSSAGVYSLRVRYEEATFQNRARLEIVKQPAGGSSEVIVASINLPASDGTIALTSQVDDKVAKSGDTMTGNLVIQAAGAFLKIVNSGESQNPYIQIFKDAIRLGSDGGYITINLPTQGGRLALVEQLNDKLNSSSAAPAFQVYNTYAVGDHCTYNGTLYRCTTAITTPGAAWDASKWTADMASNYFQYALASKTVSNGAVTLDDRAMNAVAVSSSLASLTVNFPTATSGKARDFGLRLTVASGITTAPQIVLPQGVVCENADGEAPEIGADGAATILYFTETASGVFLVKGEVLQTITQA